AFFWEGVEAGELRIQKCNDCGFVNHPPQPLCASCGTSDVGYLVSSGQGVVYSHVTHHYPKLPGVELPHTVLLVELEEGVRLVSEYAADVPDKTPTIGQRVQVAFTKVPGGALRPTFRPVMA
ncbi:MAG: zinc ribbon domain-containing protein, partial [Actinomycetota bacterium]|nr:zinc ribbon domain-containing protein [Actinomycetota bacterium]